MRKIFIIITIIFGLWCPHKVLAAGDTLSIRASRTTLGIGERVTVTIFAVSPNQALNAVSGTLLFPGNVALESISRTNSIINFWTEEPHNISGNQVSFEGIVLNPGYQGKDGTLFSLVFVAKKTGTVQFYFKDGALLANDGLGSNILDTLGTTRVSIVNAGLGDTVGFLESGDTTTTLSNKLVALPVITDYSAVADAKGAAYLKGKGEPNALTKIVFRDIALKSIGEKFITFLQTKKKKLDEVLVKNDAAGSFEFYSPSNLLAGVYNATPFLVDPDTNTEKPGLGVQLLVSDSKVVHFLVIIINVLGLLIPVVGLIVIIYFIPWYSWRRMRVLKKKLGIEEEKLSLTEHQLKQQERVIDQVAIPDEK